MNAENLVRMANRIGEFFDSYPDPVEARQGIVEHIRKFWDPRMRKALLAHMDTESPNGLSDLVIQAIQEQGADLR